MIKIERGHTNHDVAEVNGVDPPMFPGFFLYEKEPGYEYESTQDVRRNDRFRSQPCTAEACSGKTYQIHSVSGISQWISLPKYLLALFHIPVNFITKILIGSFSHSIVGNFREGVSFMYFMSHEPFAKIKTANVLLSKCIQSQSYLELSSHQQKRVSKCAFDGYNRSYPGNWSAV